MNCFGIRGQLQPGATKTACNPCLLYTSYCTYCYQNGGFTADCTMDEMIDFCIRFEQQQNPGLEVRGGKSGNWNVNGWNIMLRPMLVLDHNEAYACLLYTSRCV